MNILVLNCGSSSLKYQLINMDDESVIAKGLVERIGIEGSVLTHKPTGKDKYVVETLPGSLIPLSAVYNGLFLSLLRFL